MPLFSCESFMRFYQFSINNSRVALFQQCAMDVMLLFINNRQTGRHTRRNERQREWKEANEGREREREEGKEMTVIHTSKLINK